MKCTKCLGDLRFGEYQNKQYAFCDKCRIRYDYDAYSRNSSATKKYDGIIKYSIWNGKKEVYCPRCKSRDCSHYQEQRSIKGKAKYTPNLNPLKPFTILNKKENYKINTVSRILCNKCGNIFD